MSTYHYDETPTPVGNPVTLNRNENAYELGLYDGGLHSEQYADEPEDGVIFGSPAGAKEWLEAVIEVLTPYIESGDRSARIPDGNGWGA